MLVLGMPIKQDDKSNFVDGNPDQSLPRDAPPPMSSLPLCVTSKLPYDLLEVLKNKHDAIFSHVPATITNSGTGPLRWRAVLKRYIGDHMFLNFLRGQATPTPENFERYIIVRIEMPYKEGRKEHLKAFFDIYSTVDYMREKCAIRLGLVSKYDMVNKVRWCADEDRRFKRIDPRLHFNWCRHEWSNFVIVKHLGEFDIVFGWNTIQRLQLLEPKLDSAFAGGRREPAPSVDETAAKSNQALNAQIRDAERERIWQHSQKKRARNTVTAAAATTQNQNQMASGAS